MSGFLFCGIRELPVQNSSLISAQPMSGWDQMISSSLRRGKVHHYQGGGGGEFDCEITIRNGVHAVSGDPLEAERPCQPSTVDGDGGAGEGAASQSEQGNP